MRRPIKKIAFRVSLGVVTLTASIMPLTAQAAWQPDKTIEFIATAGPGGGTDQFARIVQSIVQKYQLAPAPVVVSNKGGGAGTEAFVYAEGLKGDPHKLIFSTNLAWLMPMVTQAGYKIENMTPVATMAADEFLLWTSADAPYRTARDLIDDARKRGKAFRMGGAGSKDTDHILTHRIESATGIDITYVPFKSGGQAAVQLAGAHVDSNTNNPSENISYWRAKKVRPLCVFASQPLADKTVVADGMSWADIALCKDQGIAIDAFRMPRTVWMPGGVSDAQRAFYIDMLKQVTEKPEWQAWLARGMQSAFFQSGAALETYIAQDKQEHQSLFARYGWLVQ